MYPNSIYLKKNFFTYNILFALFAPHYQFYFSNQLNQNWKIFWRKSICTLLLNWWFTHFLFLLSSIIKIQNERKQSFLWMILEFIYFSGFDPWRVVKNRKQLFMLREAEIKHARIAMLAAVGWPASELCHYTFAKMFGMYRTCAKNKIFLFFFTVYIL